MKIRSISELEDKLDEDISWRKKELTVILQNYKDNNQIQEAYSKRVAVVFIYAHWEGFIKNSSIAYLTYLCSQSLRYKDLKPNFIALSLIDRIPGTFSEKKILHKKVLVDFLLGDMDEKFNIDPTKKIDTRSNLNIETMLEICNSVGVDGKEFNLKKIWIDERLLHYRNGFSHGEKLNEELPFNIKDLKDEIQSLLELYKNLIVNAASNREYLREVIL